MNDYKRLVSYIYSYPGGVRDKNVGFAKAEVRNGQFKLSVSLKGVYTDTPEIFGVYLMVDKDEKLEGRFTLLKLGNVIVNAGIGNYSGIMNSENINSTLYTFEDINGIAVANKNNRFYMMFSMWADCDVNPAAVNFAPEGSKKQSRMRSEAANESASKVTQIEIEPAKEKEPENSESAGTEELAGEQTTTQQFAPDQNASIIEMPRVRTKLANENENTVLQNINQAEELGSGEAPEQLEEGLVLDSGNDYEGAQSIRAQLQAASLDAIRARDGFEALFENADFIDAFDDDYYYNCVEVTPEQLKRLPIEDEAVVNNSYLVHGYYNFKHILFGKVQENDNNTRYFIGVPGMYCNRERFMASMFGFRNFKKSHRSDYSNPYFGYWYQEI